MSIVSFLALLLVASACGDNRQPATRQDAGGRDVADAPAFTWAGAVIGGSQDDDVLDLAIDEHAIYVAGYRDGVLGTQNIEPAGNSVGIVEAYTPEGTLAWQQRFETGGSDTVEAIAVASTDVAVLGRTNAAFVGFFNAGQMDAFVARVPHGGTTSPSLVQFGDERPQHFVRIVREISGAVLVAGYDDAYVEGRALVDAENPSFARVTSELTVDWVRRDATPATDFVFALEGTAVSGEMFAGGTITSGADAGPFVRRLDPAGAVRWSRKLGSSGFDAVTALALGPDGMLYAAGTTFEVLGERSYGGQDVFVAVLDPTTGSVVRAMQAGSPDADFPRDMAFAPDGTIYVAGETAGSLPGGVAAGSYDLALVRFAADGTWTGSWQQGTPEDETARAVVVAGDTVFVGGYSYGAVVPGASPAGARDGFVLRVPLGNLAAP